MIRVTVELVPFGDESRKVVIASAKIRNDGTGTPSRGNYECVFLGRRGKLIGTSELKNFPRRRLLVWDLIGQCLNKLLAERWK